MAKQLPANPNITHLKNQAKDLQKAAQSGDQSAVVRIGAAHPAPPEAVESLPLRDAQLTIAREYGFESWHALNTEVGQRMVEERDLHRWFGVQLNNGIWNHLDSADVGPSSPLDDREHLLYSAYASAYHWRNAGTVANQARGEHLISRTATAVGMSQRALEHAQRCVELIEAHPDDTEDWDLAFALEALARAQAGSGDVAAARETLGRARASTAAIVDPGDREIVEGELARGPWFGLD